MNTSNARAASGRAALMAGAALFVLAGSQVADAATGATATDSPSASEVVVTGRKFEATLMEKKKAANEISILTPEEISRRPVSNIVDAVSILPGVSVFADNGRGQAATGEPEYITIDGIASNYNAYTLNGARVPAADPATRALSLKLLPPFGIQSVVVVKTPDASFDGDSIGGVLDIRTPSAFDYAGPLTKITAQGQLQKLASDNGFPNLGGAIQGEIARRFMGDKLGVYATVFYKQENTISEAGEVASYKAQSYGDIGKPYDSIALAPTQFKWDLQQNDITTTGGAFGLDYRQGSSQFYVRGTAVSYDDQSTDSQLNIRSTGSGYTTANADGTLSKSTDPSARLTMFNPFEGHYFQLRDQVDSLYTVQAGGNSSFGRLNLTYEGFWGYASLAQPNYVEGSLYGKPLSGGAFQVGLDRYTPSYAFSSLSGSGLSSAQVANYVLDQRNNAIWKYQGQDEGSRAQQYGFKTDGDYRLDNSILTSLQFGLDINSSNRSVWDHYFVAGNNNIYVLSPSGTATNYDNPQGLTTNNIPGRNVPNFLGFPGGGDLQSFRAFLRGALVNPALAVKYKDVECIPDTVDGRTCPGPYSENDYNAGSASDIETIYAGYVAAHLQLGEVELIPGLRYEETDFHGKSWLDETATTGQYAVVDHSYGEVLPQVAAIWRPDSSWVVRGSVRKGFSRPAFSDVIPNGGFSVVEPSGGQAGQVIVNVGNPNLKPTESINYDGSVEFYGVRDSVFELGLFYKDLSNFIYTSTTTGAPLSSGGGTATVGLPEGLTVPAGYTVMVNAPQNGSSGHLEGLTLNAQQRLRFLPGLASGLGYNANLTVQHSQTRLGGWLPQSPDLIYNLEATYELRGVHAALAYQYTGLQLVNFGNGNDGDIPQYLQPIGFLNLSAGYRLGAMDLTFQAKNLTDSPTFWKTAGKSDRYLGVQDGGGNGSYIKFGPTFKLTATYNF